MQNKLLLLPLVAILLIYSCGSTKAKRQYGFVNSSNETVTAYMLKNDSTYIKKFVMPPQSTAYLYDDTGRYAIRTRDADGKKIYESAYHNVGERIEGKSAYCWIDVTGEYNYVIANAAFLYKGKNSLAEAIANTNGNSLAYLVQERFDGAKFMESYRDGTAPYADLPKETGALSGVYVWVPVSKTITDKAEERKAIIKHLVDLAGKK